jgi:hypothetical protein
MGVIAFVAIFLILIGCLIGSELDTKFRRRMGEDQAMIRRERWEEEHRS